VLSLSWVLDNYRLAELVMLEETAVKHFLHLALDVLRLHHALLELCVLPLELIPLCQLLLSLACLTLSHQFILDDLLLGATALGSGLHQVARVALAVYTSGKGES